MNTLLIALRKASAKPIIRGIRYEGFLIQVIYRKGYWLVLIVMFEARQITTWNRTMASRSVAIDKALRAVEERAFSGGVLSVTSTSVFFLITCSRGF